MLAVTLGGMVWNLPKLDNMLDMYICVTGLRVIPSGVCWNTFPKCHCHPHRF